MAGWVCRGAMMWVLSHAPSLVDNGFAGTPLKGSNPQPSDPWISMQCLQPSTQAETYVFHVQSRPHETTANGSQRRRCPSMGADMGLSFAYIPYYDIVMWRSTAPPASTVSMTLLSATPSTMPLRTAFYELLPTRHGEDTR